MTTNDLTPTEALTSLNRTKMLTPKIAEVLGLNLDAVRRWANLPKETADAMIEALIPRLAAQFCVSV